MTRSTEMSQSKTCSRFGIMSMGTGFSLTMPWAQDTRGSYIVRKISPESCHEHVNVSIHDMNTFRTPSGYAPLDNAMDTVLPRVISSARLGLPPEVCCPGILASLLSKKTMRNVRALSCHQSGDIFSTSTSVPDLHILSLPSVLFLCVNIF